MTPPRAEPSPRSSVVAPILTNLILIAGSVAVALCLAEVALRVLGISYPIFDTWDADRGVILMPGKEGWYRQEGQAYLRINGLGYRDVEHATTKPAGVLRIAVLGDSFAEARQVEVKDTFWKRLENEPVLSEAIRPRRIEVLNFGVGGYGTAQAMLTFEKDAVRFEPDIVVLQMFVGNDFVNNSRALSYRAQDAFRPFFLRSNDGLELDTSFRQQGFATWKKRLLLTTIHYSRVLELLNQVRRNHLIGQLQASGKNKQSNDSTKKTAPVELGTYTSVFVAPQEPDWKEAWAVTERMLETLHEKVKAADARLVVLVTPTAISVHPSLEARAQYRADLGIDDFEYPDRRLQAHSRKTGYALVPLTRRLQQVVQASKEPLHGFDNAAIGFGHWNERGHAHVAAILAQHLAEHPVAAAPQAR